MNPKNSPCEKIKRIFYLFVHRSKMLNSIPEELVFNILRHTDIYTVWSVKQLLKLDTRRLYILFNEQINFGWALDNEIFACSFWHFLDSMNADIDLYGVLAKIIRSETIAIDRKIRRLYFLRDQFPVDFSTYVTMKSFMTRVMLLSYGIRTPDSCPIIRHTEYPPSPTIDEPF